MLICADAWSRSISQGKAGQASKLTVMRESKTKTKVAGSKPGHKLYNYARYKKKINEKQLIIINSIFWI